MPVDRAVMNQHMEDFVVDLHRLTRTTTNLFVRMSVKSTLGADLLRLYQEYEGYDYLACQNLIELASDNHERTQIVFRLPRRNKMTAQIQLRLAEELGYESETDGNTLILRPAKTA